MSDKERAAAGTLSIEFKFSTEQAAKEFGEWNKKHFSLDMDVEQLLAHAKAHGAVHIKLGDGTEWSLAT